MIKSLRHKRILSILRKEGVIELSALARVMPETSLVTLRRDLSELAEAGALRRTHGGATLPDDEVLKGQGAHILAQTEGFATELEHLDAVVLPPIPGHGGDALRRQIMRSNIPFIAESAAQQGGTYLGPDNRQAGFDLGRHAAQSTTGTEAHLLLITQPELANTSDRVDGFEAGFRQHFQGHVHVARVNGQGSYRPALRVAIDALKTQENISVAFGVNDHSALAAIEAAQKLNRHLDVYAAGGESPNFVKKLGQAGLLRAVVAFFPEVVGVRAVDLVANAMRGATLPAQAITPHAVVTPQNLAEFYGNGANGWGLLDSKRAALVPDMPVTALTGRIGFMPHYPAHDWYRVMMQAMQLRAAEMGLQLVVSPPHQGIAAEMSRLRREIGRVAADTVTPGQTIIIGEGEATRFMAEALHQRAVSKPSALRDVTVITNALDVMTQLQSAEPLKVILTSGEYQQADNCLVGPSLGALFERVRADTAFLSVAGAAPGFGISAVDERRALAGTRFVDAARRVVALADHAAIGAEANHRIAPAGAFHEIITDDGALPADRQRLRAAGVEVLIANEAEDPSLQNADISQALVRET